MSGLASVLRAFWSLRSSRLLRSLYIATLPVLLCGCDTILQYPSGGEEDPVPEEGRLTLALAFDMNFNMLGEFSYDYESQTAQASSATRGDDGSGAALRRLVINAYRADDVSAAPVAVSSRTLTLPVSSGDRFEIEFPLPSGQYRIVVWADHVDSQRPEWHYYDASDFSEIVLRGEEGHRGSDELRDAFYGETTVDFDAASAERREASVDLCRPMARYSFVSVDLKDFLDRERARTKEGSTATLSSLSDYRVRIVYPQYMPCSFNAHTGKPVDSRLGVEYSSSISALDGEQARLGFDYVFTNGTDTSVAVAMEVIHSDGTVVARMPKFDVPLRRSHHTTVTGRFLTTRSGGPIGVNPEFDGDFNIEIR